jgi:hypothetical protein
MEKYDARDWVKTVELVKVLSLEDLRSLNKLVNAAITAKGLLRKANFSVGDRVKVATPNKAAWEGTVAKINPKRVIVKSDIGDTKWSVPPTLLEKVA